MTNTTQVRILYIEDDPLIGELFKTVVEENGYSVDLAYNGKHGLSLLKKNNYDVLATDYDLPDLTGLEICREVLSKQPNFPIVMVTGKGGEGIAAEALNLGVSNYIQKDSQSTFVNLLPAVISKLVARSRELADHQASEDLFRTMVSVSPTAIHFHQNMKIVFANPAMVKLRGKLRSRHYWPLCSRSRAFRI